jgi:hypothetical protein
LVQQRQRPLLGAQLGYRANQGYEYDCYYTIVIRLTATTIYRSQRNNRRYTHH